MGSKDAAYWGKRAEVAAARKYGLERVGNEWYDAKYVSNGRKVQIKATRRRLSSGRPGRFRFWLRDHKQICDKQGSYICVLYSPGAGLQRIEKVASGDVTAAAGAWSESGHKLRAGSNTRQTKIRWDRLL